MERGTVSMRVAFVLRSAEVQPLCSGICAMSFCNYALCMLAIGCCLPSPVIFTMSSTMNPHLLSTNQHYVVDYLLCILVIMYPGGASTFQPLNNQPIVL